MLVSVILLVGLGLRIYWQHSVGRRDARGRALAARAASLSGQLREAERREAERREAIDRTRRKIERSLSGVAPPDAGWICDRFLCSDVQRPPAPNSHEPSLIRDVPAGYGSTPR